MRVHVYPILIISLGLLAGFAFYTLYHTAATPPPTTVTLEDKTRDDSMVFEEQMPLDSEISSIKHASIKRSPIKIPTVEKEIQNQTAQRVMETPEHTQEIYDAMTPDNYDETMEKANEAFTALDDESSEAHRKLLEEEAQIKRDASSIEDDEQS